jgi:hypothetical protein
MQRVAAAVAEGAFAFIANGALTQHARQAD